MHLIRRLRPERVEVVDEVEVTADEEEVTVTISMLLSCTSASGIEDTLVSSQARG